MGFVELGQGASTALLQVAAEELDLEMSQVKSVRVETHTAPNQGGTVAGSAIMREDRAFGLLLLKHASPC